MKYMVSYDLMESVRNANQWLGATAHAWGNFPLMAMTANPMVEWTKAWGEVTERSFARMVTKPDWNIPTIAGHDGRDHTVRPMKVVEAPFGDLIHFKVAGRAPKDRRVLLIAPMSGHYATLLRKTVVSLIPDCEVFITDWHNARDIPVSAGSFDVEDYTLYLVDFMKHLGPDLHVIAVCQPVPLALAATAYLAEEQPDAQPKSLTLIGGPVDPEANHTDVTDFGRSVTMGLLEETMCQRVGFKYKGVGRMVYPGLLQLASFISMNAETHAQAFQNQIMAVARGDASDHDKHNAFYDEYLSVMDMPAEFYLSTVKRVFKEREIARNVFTVGDRVVDFGKITTVAVKIVEGEDDDISAPGQCLAALDLLTGLPQSKKASHLERGAGHYGIFAGRSWRDNIRPLVLKFIDANSGKPEPKEKARRVTPTTPANTDTPTKAEATKAEAPKAQAANVDAVKVETTKSEAPKAETAKAEAPKSAAPKPEAVKADASKAVAPEPAKAEAPKAEALKTEPAKAEAPKVNGTKARPAKGKARRKANGGAMPV